MGKKNRKKFWGTLAIISAAVLLVFIAATVLGYNFSSIVNMVLNVEATKTVGDPGKIYYEKDFATGPEQTANAERLCEEVIAKGAVLLKNEEREGQPALPVSPGSRVSLFGKGAAQFIYAGTGSGGMDTSKAITLKDALEENGFLVNDTLWSFYTDGAGKDYQRESPAGSMNNHIFDNSGFKVNEVPLDAYSEKEWDSAGRFGDAAVVVFGRQSGEGYDLAWFNSGDEGNGGNLLSLTREEKDLLRKIAELKKEGAVKKIIVLLNTSNSFELDFLNPSIGGEDFGIDACLWVGEVGQTGIRAIGKLLDGSVNPSGKLVDTFLYDNLTSPALQNAFVTSFTNAEEQGLAFDKLCNEYYVVYQEGIYVGYRYYETRYEDYVLGNRKVGNYDYGKTVAYPFGYGLSYSDFSYENLSMDESGSAFEFTVDVRNNSSIDGEEVVQIFMQAPYTSYDREYGIEKAAVELVGYRKVKVPAGETVKGVKVSVNKTELRSYDAANAGTYILEGGNYYFALGNGSHEALNNILAAKADSGDDANGSVMVSRMDGKGDSALAVLYHLESAVDSSVFAVSANGTAITNQFDHADLNKFDDDPSNDVVYLTRQDWAGTMPKAYLTEIAYEAAVQIAANDEIVAAMNETYQSGASGTMPVMGKEGDLRLAQFIGVPLDGSIEKDGVEYTWNDLMDQVTFNEMAKLIGLGFHNTMVVTSVAKPSTKDENGPLGITATLTGGGSSMSYTSKDVLAATYDQELIEAIGVSIGNDCLFANLKAYSGIYGPGANIHRTPYSGRNFEYYSEDPFLTGRAAAAEVKGIQSKGVYVYIKHFALNDQETGRDGIAVWANEQSIREIYLQAFETPVTESGAYNVMTGFNRIGPVWAGADGNLQNNVLKGEWGMKGFSLTDYSNSNDYMDVYRGLMGGSDCWDANDTSKWTVKLKDGKDDPQLVTAMRESSQRILYTVAQSNAMNGISVNLEVIEIMPWWKILLLSLDGLFAILTGVTVLLFFRAEKKQ